MMDKKIKAVYYDRDKDWKRRSIEIDESLLKFDPEKEGDEQESIYTLALEIFDRDKEFFSNFNSCNVDDDADWELKELSDAQAKDWDEALTEGIYVVCDWEKDGETEGSDVHMKVELYDKTKKLVRDDLIQKSKDADKGGK